MEMFCDGMCIIIETIIIDYSQLLVHQLLVCYSVLGTCMEPYMKSTIMSDDDVLRLIVTKKKLNVKELTTEDKLYT